LKEDFWRGRNIIINFGEISGIIPKNFKFSLGAEING